MGQSSARLHASHQRGVRQGSMEILVDRDTGSIECALLLRGHDLPGELEVLFPYLGAAGVVCGESESSQCTYECRVAVCYTLL